MPAANCSLPQRRMQSWNLYLFLWSRKLSIFQQSSSVLSYGKQFCVLQGAVYYRTLGPGGGASRSQIVGSFPDRNGNGKSWGGCIICPSINCSFLIPATIWKSRGQQGIQEPLLGKRKLWSSPNAVVASSIVLLEGKSSSELFLGFLLHLLGLSASMCLFFSRSTVDLSAGSHQSTSLASFTGLSTHFGLSYSWL